MFEHFRRLFPIAAAVLVACVLPLASPGQDSGEAGSPTVSELGQLLADGRYAEVERRARQGLADGPGDPMDEASLLDVLVEALWRAGKEAGEETLTLARRALTLRESGSSLDNVGHVLRLRGDWAGARGFFERALTLREATLGLDHPELARSLNSLGWVAQKAGDFDAAESAYRRSIRIVEAALGSDHPDLANSLNNLGLLHRDLGDYVGARASIGRALEVFESNLGPRHERVASVLNGLAGVEKKSGLYVEARRHYERALAIWREGRSYRGTAATLSNLGDLHRRMGDYAAASRLLGQALEIFERNMDPDHPVIATHLNTMATVLMDAGQNAAALPLLRRSLAIREARLGVTHVKVAQVLHNLGHLQTSVGNTEAARALLSRALDIRVGHLEAGHPDIGATLVNLAQLEHREGLLDRAHDLIFRAARIYEAGLGEDHPETVRCRVYGADVLLEMGRGEQALDTALRAEESGRRHLSLTLRTLTERDALAYAAVRPAGHDTVLSILASSAVSPASRTRAWDALARSRALVLDEMRVRHGAATAVPRQVESLAEASERLANLLVQGASGQGVESYRRALDHAEARREDAERALAEASLSFRHHRRPERNGLDEILSALPAGSALVAYSRFEARAFGRRVGTAAAGGGASYVALVRPAGAAQAEVVPLGGAERIEAAALRWGHEVRSARGRLAAESSRRRYRAASLGLRQAVWDPLAELLKGAERIFVVPDGALQQVHLATLVTDDDRFLIETAAPIHYLSAERDLVRRTRRPHDGGLLAVGGPAFGPESRAAAGRSAPCDGLAGLHFGELPGTLGEAARVAEIVGVDMPDAVTRLLGADATESAFKRLAPGREALHLATHGFFVEDRCPAGVATPLSSATALRLVEATVTEARIISGVALSGANQRRGADDGVLTDREIASLDLSGVGWVVLSACDTGLGRVRSGEGVLGLRRAFDLAGAETLIMSLWPVGDEWTVAWMEQLYSRRVGGASTLEAVHGASLELLQRRRARGRDPHPFYWGAFVAVGAWD